MRNVKIDEVDRLDRDVVALGNDYAQGFILPPHQHRRAQLLYGATGLMYVTTQDGEWGGPPQHAVWIPPETVHAVRFAGVTTRSLYIEPDCVAAFIKHRRCEVISVSPLLRQLLLEAVDIPDGLLDAAALKKLDDGIGWFNKNYQSLNYYTHITEESLKSQPKDFFEKAKLLIELCNKIFDNFGDLERIL
ncbi:TPA: AraC family ligand binding domain-containing protein, partial [Klebsiella pneumoniae]